MGLLPWRMGLAAVSAVLLSSPQPTAAADSASGTIEVRKVVEDYFKALNDSKLEVVVGLYHQDSVFLPKNAPAARGLDEIRKAYRTLFAKAKLDTQHVYHHVSAYGDVAIVESQGRGTLTLLESKRVVASNHKELFVLRKIANQWKIDRYMFNDSEPQGA